ncbi:hypothetical protein Pcinc_005053, partial [Petrolisthes cinctipes]
IVGVDGGRAYIREATVALPRTWRMDSPTCSLLTPVTTTASSSTHTHIRVTTNHPVFGSRPWVQQSQGCGRQGDYIQLGSDFLRNNNNNNNNGTKTHIFYNTNTTKPHNSHTQSARLLLAEWVKFRWGIFEERGYQDDPLYPLIFRDPTSGVHRPNACPLQKPRPELQPQPFCPTEAHISEAPTKHNAQCVGRPAWDIIIHSHDFALEGRDTKEWSTNSTPTLLPKLRFVQESAARIVLVVEDTAVMNMQQRWEFVRKAVRRVVVYDIPDGNYVALVVFNSVARTSAPLSRMDSLSDVRQRVGSSLPRNPSPVPESKKCVLCGLQEAMRTLDTEPIGAVGATVILVTTGKGLTHQQEVEEMKRLATNRGIRVHTVLYPMIESGGMLGGSDSKELQSLVSATRGFSFTVMDEGVGNDSKVSMMVALMDALLAAVRRSEPPATPGAPVLIHSQAYPGGIASMSMGSTHTSIREGECPKEDLPTPVDHHHQQYHQRIGSSLPIVMYAEVKEEEMPIVNARVTARLQRLGTHTNGRTYNSVLVHLYDHGYGDPDITGGDGVYSRYLPILHVGGPGHYQLSVTADHNNNLAQVPVKDPTVRQHHHHHQHHHHKRVYSNSGDKVTCCGSSIGYEKLKFLKPFQRHSIYGVLEVMSPASPIDMIPPSRILDLLAWVNRTTREVVLRWTAPGDDNDWGRANHYEAVLATSWTGAKAFNGESVSGMPLPEQVTTQQAVSFHTNRYEEIVYVAIRAVDKAGNKGGVSNIATVWVPQPPTTTMSPQQFTSQYQQPYTNHTISTNKNQSVGQNGRMTQLSNWLE